MAKPSTNAQGAELVLRTVQEDWYKKHKSYYGAMQWLATELDVTRQSIDNYRKRGEFPKNHVAKICALFPSLKPSDIRPEDTKLKPQQRKTTW